MNTNGSASRGPAAFETQLIPTVDASTGPGTAGGRRINSFRIRDRIARDDGPPRADRVPTGWAPADNNGRRERYRGASEGRGLVFAADRPFPALRLLAPLRVIILFCFLSPDNDRTSFMANGPTGRGKKKNSRSSVGER